MPRDFILIFQIYNAYLDKNRLKVNLGKLAEMVMSCKEDVKVGSDLKHLKQSMQTSARH